MIELPPGMLGVVNDMWFRYVTDLGIAGPDQGKGGKYLVLPPGYDGEVPEGYFVVRPSDLWQLDLHARLYQRRCRQGDRRA